MKPFIIALTLYLFVNISSCSTNDAPIVEPPNGETAEDSNTPTMNEQIRIIIGNASFTATLEDNATTKAFKASLPITVPYATYSPSAGWEGQTHVVPSAC